jgi:hypothetical protein
MKRQPPDKALAGWRGRNVARRRNDHRDDERKRRRRNGEQVRVLAIEWKNTD